MSDIALRCSVSLNLLRVSLLLNRSSTNRTERIATTDLHSVVVDVYRETIVAVYFGRTCEGASKQELENEFQIGCFVTRGYARHEKSTRITGKLLAGKRSLFALFRRKCTGSRTGSAIEQEYSAPSFCPFLSLLCSMHATSMILVSRCEIFASMISRISNVNTRVLLSRAPLEEIFGGKCSFSLLPLIVAKRMPTAREWRRND